MKSLLLVLLLGAILFTAQVSSYHPSELQIFFESPNIYVSSIRVGTSLHSLHDLFPTTTATVQGGSDITKDTDISLSR